MNYLYCKTTSVKQNELLFILADRRSFHYILYQQHGCAALYILQSGVVELIDHWHFAVALCDANLNWMRRSKGYYFAKDSHLPSPSAWRRSGHSLASGRCVPCDYLKDDILSGPSSVVDVGEWLQDTGQFLPVSTLSAWDVSSAVVFVAPPPSPVCSNKKTQTPHTHTHIHACFCHTCSSCWEKNKLF